MELENLRIDPDVFSWHLAERLEYRKHVKVNPEYAIWVIEEALDPQDAEAPRLANGMPAAALNIDPDYIIGLIWITEHRFDGRLAFDDVKRALDDLAPQDFVSIIIDAMVVEEDEAEVDPPEGADDESAPIPTDAASPASETSSESASPTTGPETKRSRSRRSSGTTPSP